MTLKTIARQSPFYYVQWQAINYFSKQKSRALTDSERGNKKYETGLDSDRLPHLVIFFKNIKNMSCFACLK